MQQKIALGEARPAPLYPDGMKLAEKIRTIAQQIYRAADISMTDAVARRLDGFEKAGFGHVPVCIAKTQYSFTADPTVMGAPDGPHRCRCARSGCPPAPASSWRSAATS